MGLVKHPTLVAQALTAIDRVLLDSTVGPEVKAGSLERIREKVKEGISSTELECCAVSGAGGLVEAQPIVADLEEAAERAESDELAERRRRKELRRARRAEQNG